MAKKKLIKKKAAQKKVAPKTTRRKTKKASPTSQEPIYVGLHNSVELRKHLLEPTREVIQFLQSYEQFLGNKSEKAKFIDQLKEDLKLIKLDISKLRKFLPKNKIKAEKASQRIKEDIKDDVKKHPKPAVTSAPLSRRTASSLPIKTSSPKKTPSLDAPPTKKVTSAPPRTRSHPELDELEKELGDIEEKLGTIS